ncbi:MAG: hypothetical protein KAJ51_11205, partial [Thermoplasmata archaeon]|nr:hypothetical protein [Thermoplasmata archaeon]
NSTSPNGAGIDGNYSNGSGNLSDGTPKAYDQNNLPFHPDTNTTTYSNEQWYYRYTNDTEGKAINEWWIAYNDNSSSETGNFTYFFDYIFIGPNKGPLNISIPNEEVYYSTFGVLFSKVINLSANSVGGCIELDKTEYTNHSILLSVLNAEDNQPISNFNYLLGTSINISSIDYFNYPKIKLQAIFIGNGSKTPKLYSWNITWVETVISYSIAHNKIENNSIGIYCDQASTLIANNEISSSSDKGIFYNKCESYTYATTKLSDETNKTIVFEVGGSDSSAQLVIPKGVTITNASFDLTGYRYIPNSDLSKSFQYQGYAVNETTNLDLNATINVSIPNDWNAISSTVTKDNLTQNGAEIGVSYVNLSCEHNSTTNTFGTSNMVYFNSSETSDSQNPLQFNLTTNSTNVKGNFTASVYSTKSTSTTWTNTSIGYTITIPLNSPNINISYPKLKVIAPNSGFAEYNGTIKETQEDITANITDNGEYLTLDLTAVTEIGSVWGSGDTNRNITINLTYYTNSPCLDVGDDGDREWAYTGEFNSTVTINETNNGLVKELNNLTSSLGFGDENIPLVLSSCSSGKIKITNVSISWVLKPQTLNNIISSNKYGVFIEETNNITVAYNAMHDNEYGIYVLNTTAYSVTENTLADGSLLKTITFSSGSDSSCKLRLPIGAVVTNASFNLTGSRYVPYNNRTTYYEYQGTIIKSTTIALNNNVNISTPNNWTVNSATIQANWLTRPLGHAIGVWSNSSVNFSSSNWNRSSWNFNSNINMNNINWIRMAEKPDSEVIVALVLDNNNYLKSLIWNESWWGTSNNLTSVATTNTSTCF